ncbi:MAG: hypothetical protein R3332_07200 [Pseudohongiellaceae bacterium]|nr:hypothetical protein [Pseudohongiellaceae bacterium]
MTNKGKGLTLVLLLSLFGSTALNADNIRHFEASSLASLKQEFAGQPFVLSLWSIDCLPCRVELEMLGEIKRQSPDFPLLLVSTDPIEQREEAVYILEEYGLDAIDTWMFADSFVERLRFSIDPNWYGELPRSYFYDEDHNRQAHSGILSREELNRLFPPAAQL